MCFCITVCVCISVCVLFAQSCPTRLGIPARVLDWVSIPFSRGSQCVDLQYWLVREMNTEELNNLPRLHGKLLAESDELIPHRTLSSRGILLP